MYVSYQRCFLYTGSETAPWTYRAPEALLTTEAIDNSWVTPWLSNLPFMFQCHLCVPLYFRTFQVWGIYLTTFQRYWLSHSINSPRRAAIQWNHRGSKWSVCLSVQISLEIFSVWDHRSPSDCGAVRCTSSKVSHRELSRRATRFVCSKIQFWHKDY